MATGNLAARLAAEGMETECDIIGDLDTAFKEGSPYSVYGPAITKGKETRKAVQEVFDFFLTTLVYEDKTLFMPEQIFKVQPNTVPNYPRNVPAADMTGIKDLAEKQRFLEK
jgi:iron(III) transport system substrate-binding protein